MADTIRGLRRRVKARDVKWYGYRADLADPRDHLFTPAPGVVSSLPTSVDLREHCPPVMDQGELGSCTAHGITGALRYALIKSGQPDHECSRLQLYFDERSVEGTVRSDAGAEIRDGIKCAAQRGVAHETLWPYNIKAFAKKPGKAVYADALKFEALTYQRVTVDATQVKAALASGFPVIVGISVFSAFESEDVAKTGVVPMPGAKDGPIGGHCMMLVGYGQKDGHFTAQNSWATDWGDNGFCYLPEAYIGSSKYGNDYWIITKVEPSAA
ncbi:C1 family peptidase [Methylobacterium komagatae]